MAELHGKIEMFFIANGRIDEASPLEAGTYRDLELRSLDLSEYLLLECFSRDFDRLRECLFL